MDSLTEINNDMRFEHFIDESLDIDMSACAPILIGSSGSSASFFDELLNTAQAPLSAVVVRPTAQSAHDFLVRLSPVATSKRVPPSSTMMPAASPNRPAVRLFGQEQVGTVTTTANANANSMSVLKLIKTEDGQAATAARPAVLPAFTSVESTGGHAFLVPPGRLDGNAKPTVSTTKAPKSGAAQKSTPIEFYCHHCDMRIKSHVEFEKHYRAMHSAAQPTYACQVCPNKLFVNLQSYRTHVKRHSERHPCAVCTRKFITAELLAEHGRTHTSELRLQCGHCQQQFDDFDLYCQHVRVHRRPAVAKPVKWKCPDCGKLFKNRAGLNNHAKVHRDSVAAPVTSAPLIVVDLTAIPNVTTTPATTKTTPISAISGVQSSANLVTVSRKTNTAKNPAIAATSNPPAAISVTAVGGATAAVATADAARPFTCDVCQKTFPGRTQLLRHRDHHNERSFKCLTCLKFYKTERDLKVHSLVHFEQRPHACTHCGKSFLSSSKLKQHSNVHTGERPFKCKYCDKDFTNFPNWLKHVRRSHKVDHKTGEQLEQLPNFLVREKKGTAKKDKEKIDGSGGADSDVKPKTAAGRKAKTAVQQQQQQLRPPDALTTATMFTIKQEPDSALDLHDTNAVTATTASASSTVLYQDEASLPLDLRDMSASIQLQQSIDVHDMQQMQLLIPSHDESFASIEDVSSEHLQHVVRKLSPLVANNKTAGRTKATSSATTKPIKSEPGRFSFARTAEQVAAATTPPDVSFLTLISQSTGSSLTANETTGFSSSGGVATGGIGTNINNTTTTGTSPAVKKQQLSPHSANVPRRHFGGVATSHMFATNVL